ncbi:unnamed protein product [Calypogeia fissa]
MADSELTRDMVLKRDIPWETYLTAKLITTKDLTLLRRYDHRRPEQQATLLDDNGVAYVGVFVGILSEITKQDTVEYVLAMIDEMLSANPTRARLFHDKTLEGEDVYGTFLKLLSKRKWFIQEMSCKILTLIISARPEEPQTVVPDRNGKQAISDFDKILGGLVEWLSDQLRHPDHPTRATPTAVSSLATLLRERQVRSLFVKAGGVEPLADLVAPATNQQYIQLLYEATLSVWLLTFYDLAVEALTEAKVVPRLVEVVKASTKEKVARVALMSLKNLVKKGSFGSELIALGFPKILQNLRLQAWNDEDLNQALDMLESTLKDNAKELNSFDTYKMEVTTGHLDWTPVHKDPVFWKENCKKFEENDYELLRILIATLETSSDPKSLAVACNDISQFIGNHPSGRGIISDLKAKERIMQLMANDNPDVAREALLCVQKILLSAKYVSYMQ